MSAGSGPAAGAVATYIFLDLETTGLPGRERADTRIVELCALAVPAAALRAAPRAAPAPRTLSFLLDPGRALDPLVARLTGLQDAELRAAGSFPQQFERLRAFLKAQPAPRCLLAHNGYAFDFRILLAECRAARRRLPAGLLCLDSLRAFRQLDKLAPAPHAPPPVLSDIVNLSQNSNVSSVEEDDQWPDLNLSNENWQEIDDICQRLSDVSTDPDSPQKPKTKVTRMTNKPKNIFPDTKSMEISKIFAPKTQPVAKVQTNANKSYKLVDLYERLVGKSAVNAHRAEADCMMLMECVIATKDTFLPWADKNCRQLSEIKPIPKYNPNARRK